DHPAREPLDFERVASFEIVVEGRRHPVRLRVGECQALMRVVFRQGDAQRAADGYYLLHDVEQKRARLRVLAYRSYIRAHRGRRGGKSDEEYVLLPDRSAD